MISIYYDNVELLTVAFGVGLFISLIFVILKMVLKTFWN